jgi:HK97 family phage portal protein
MGKFRDWLLDAEPPSDLRTSLDPPPPPVEYQIESIELAQLLGNLDAETLPAVYAAVDLISASVARLGFDEETRLSRRPDPFVTRFDFFFETTWSLAASGNAYWRQTRTERGVDSLEVLDPSAVVVRLDERSRRRRVYEYEGEPVDRISHLRFHPRPGRLLGLSPIEASRTTWNGAVYAERYASKTYAESGIPSGVLKAEYELTDAESTRLKQQWTAARSGARSTAVLSGGITYEGIALSLVDLQFLDARASTALDVARIFHIPSDLLEVAVSGSSLTYQNLAEVGADLVRWCLDAYLQIIEEAWALLPGEPADRTFDTRPLYAASAETRARTLGLLVAAGADPGAAAAETEFRLPMSRPAPIPEASNV